MKRNAFTSLSVLMLMLNSMSYAGTDTAITLLHLNDLHGNLTAHAEQIRTANPDSIQVDSRGGLARLAQLINSIRNNNPDGTVLTNTGDTYHGSGEALFSNGNVVVDLVNRLPIDLGVAGNWDYAYGPIVTNARFGNLIHDDVLRPTFPILGANAIYRNPPNITNPPMQQLVQQLFNFSPGDPVFPATAVIERQGIQIGFIGLTSDIVERMHETMAFNIEFTQGESNYLSTLQQHSQTLRDSGADLVVVLSELGIHKDWALAQSLPVSSVDVFFSAHTHELTETPLITPHGIRVMEAGNDAWLGQLDVTFDAQQHPIDFHWQVHAIDDSLMPDPKMEAAVIAARAPFLTADPNLPIPAVSLPGLPDGIAPEPFSMTLHHSLDAVVGHTHTPLDRRNALNAHLNQAFTDALRNQFGTDIAMTPGFRFDASVIPPLTDFNGLESSYPWQDEGSGLLHGEVLAGDAYRAFPAPFVLAQGEVTGQRLREIIEELLDFVFSNTAFDQSGGWVDGFSGLNVQVDLSQPIHQRVLTLEDDALQPIQSHDQLTATGCARPFDQDATHTLCSHAGFTNVQNLINPVTGEEWAAADYLIEALEAGAFEEPGIQPRATFTDRSGQPLWPHSPFYQPLEGARAEVIHQSGFE